MKNYFRELLILIVLFGITTPLLCQTNQGKSGITIVSWLLRDRAVIIDSLVMRKCAYIAFKTNYPLSKVKSCAVAGSFSHNGNVLSRDTTWLFDEAAGNLGFNLPFVIPDDKYEVKIQIIKPDGNVLDETSQVFDRQDLKPYFNREIQFWDFTTPYAQLECSGYGNITYHFNYSKEIPDVRNIEVSARMNSDNEKPGLAEVFLNGISLGILHLPTGDESNSVVSLKFENAGHSRKISVLKGENQLSFVVSPEFDSEGMGMRIFSRKNSNNPTLKPEIPITLKISPEKSAESLTIAIPVWGEEGEHITSKFNIPAPKSFHPVIPNPEPTDLCVNQSDVKQGFVLFSKDFESYVYPYTVPMEKERIDSLNISMSRNDFEPATFSVYPIRDLGLVKVSVSDLTGPGGKSIPSGNILIQVAQNLKIRTGDGDGYRLIPRVLDRTNQTNIPVSYSTRFWLTIHADSATLPGTYLGKILIKSENEQVKILPFKVLVLPIKLEPVPDIDYSMCMSYEFFELESKEWNAAQKEKIYQDGLNSFRDYLNHGMTTVAISSPYYFQWNKDGTPRLEHLQAMIRASKEAGFTRPVYWYFGHYVQSAKGQHPGNIRLYNPKIHPERAKYLVETAMKYSKSVNGLPVRFMPIDEPRIALRQKIALELFQEIKKVPGGEIMCTTNIGGRLLDIENDSQADRKTLAPGEKIRKSDRKVWEYSNSAVDARNPGYSRYIYGYYTWRQDLDGMNSWGPGTTENSRGNPYEDLDHEYPDYAITYPHSGGPLATPNWEALREGIDDVRYVYQLEKLCQEKAKQYPEEVKQVEKFLDELRAMCDFDDNSIINEFGQWTPDRFNSIRKQVVSRILKLQKM